MKKNLLLLCLFLPLMAAAQTDSTARTADTGSADAIVAALYDVISGPAGQKRDWNRMRSLFLPGARLIATAQRPSGEVVNRVMTVEDYIATSGVQIETKGFFEREISRKTENFGNIMHVFSTYEARQQAEDQEPFMRGINSIQLLYDGKRWWIVTVYWQAENEKQPLPKKYLRRKK